MRIFVWLNIVFNTNMEPENPIEQAAQQERAPRPARRTRTLVFQAYLAAALLISTVLAILASTSAYFSIDLTLTQFLQSLASPQVSGLARFISWFGFVPQAPLVTGLICAAIWWMGFRREAANTAGAAVASLVVNMAIKYIVQRPRPDANLVDVFHTLTSPSFPSGHVMFYMGFFGFLWFLGYTQLRASTLRSVILVVLGALVVLVGFSRIYLGEHWASDVVGGYLVGSLVLAGSVSAYQVWTKKSES